MRLKGAWFGSLSFYSVCDKNRLLVFTYFLLFYLLTFRCTFRFTHCHPVFELSGIVEGTPYAYSTTHGAYNSSVRSPFPFSYYSIIRPLAPSSLYDYSRKETTTTRVISRGTRENGVPIVEVFTRTHYGRHCGPLSGQNALYFRILHLPDPRGNAPDACTQTPIYAWLASVPVVPVLRNDHWTAAGSRSFT